MKMTIVERAIRFAEKKHGNQMYGEHPYIKHLKDVQEIAKGLGFSDEVQSACILHDILEDTNTKYQEIKDRFGFEVAEAVYAVTDELGRNRKERKEKTYPKIHNSYMGTIVKVCDRIANFRFSKVDSMRHHKMYIDEMDDFFNDIYNPFWKNGEVYKAWILLYEENKPNQVYFFKRALKNSLIFTSENKVEPKGYFEIMEEIKEQNEMDNKPFNDINSNY